jgi:hypothetical protein
MFEFIIAGFTGTFLSYLIAFGSGSCFESCMTQPLREIDNKLTKIDRKIEHRWRQIHPYNR